MAEWWVGTYARPQDYALNPKSYEGKERPKCEMNAEEDYGFYDENQSVNRNPNVSGC